MARRLGQLENISVSELRGISDDVASQLEDQMGIANVLDLLTHFPRRHVPWTRIRDLKEGQDASVLAKVQRASRVPSRGRRAKPRVAARVSDGTGSLDVTYFNQPWRASQLKIGMPVVLQGKVTTYRGRRQLTNPVTDLIGGDGPETDRMVPIYPQSDKARIYTRDFESWIGEALRRAGEFADPVPQWVLDRFGLVDRTTAFRGIHQPATLADDKAARKRLILDELLRVQLALVERKRQLERTTPGIAHGKPGALVEQFWQRLPFEPTEDQRHAIDEIAWDLIKPFPMHRLLQGDVGSGKTIVGVAALLVAVEGGHQGAFMAPTEVLAEQHAQGIRQLLDDMVVGDSGATLFGERPLRVELLTNRVAAADRRRILADLAAGQVDIVIGTHALIQEQVEFASLGVVVIDEQHRFGVEQRAALREKAGEAAVPDVLVMTATPIPRTAAMTVYGDLDVTVIRSRPAGRQPITTTWARTPEEEEEVWESVRREVAAGRQAYVICPVIEDSDKLEARSAEDTYMRLEGGELKGLRLGLLHGRLTPADKDATMHQFREGRLDVLVATTVIEVGVDVPNATVMVILTADRFGIAQLHQLRGRVGRGSERSWCFMVSESDTPEAQARLEALVANDDGFELAEVDLELRGEGTIMGERQKGRNDLKLASLRRDRDWVERARDVAIEIVDGEGGLAAHPGLVDEVALFLDEDDQEFLLKG